MLYNHITYPLSENDLKMVVAIPEGGNWKHIPLNVPSKRLERIRKTGGRTTLYGRLSWTKPSYTITTYFNRPGNGAYIHPKDNRVISAREAARLQSFPDDYIFYGSKTSFCKQIGNAVPPLLAYFIAKKIKEYTGTKNILDLFCGSGGLSKGFEWAGYNIIAANDNFKYACETYKNNHKATILVEGDITKKDIKEKLYRSIKNKKIDIIIGGPPCQGFSYAGKRIIEDPRNFLFKEFVEIVKKVKPKVILIENVEGILTSNDGKTFESIKESFSELGYKMHGKKMLAVKFGVPQKRKRVVIIGVLKGNPEKCYPQEIIIDENKYISVKNAIGNLPSIEVNGGENIFKKKIDPKSLYQEFLAGNISPKKYEEMLTKTF
ncbi:MAG: DNA (cytosine-5-)-methyltransferase [Minisyncoccia bacterium]